MLVHPKVSLLDRCISGQSCKCTNKGLYINSQADTSKGLNTSKGLSTNKITCICIPRLDITITKNYVVDIIKKLNWGKIISISCVVNRKNVSTPFVSVFIDIEWFETCYISNIRKIMSEGHAIKVVFNKYIVWKIYEKKNNTHIHN